MEELFKSLSESVSEECYNEIMGIVEEIINEVSVGAWARAAGNHETYIKRRQAADKAREVFNNTSFDGNPEWEKNKNDYLNARHKLVRIERVHNLLLPKNSKVSSKKLLDKAERYLLTDKRRPSYKKTKRALAINAADPTGYTRTGFNNFRKANKDLRD